MWRLSQRETSSWQYEIWWQVQRYCLRAGIWRHWSSEQKFLQSVLGSVKFAYKLGPAIKLRKRGRNWRWGWVSGSGMVRNAGGVCVLYGVCMCGVPLWRVVHIVWCMMCAYVCVVCAVCVCDHYSWTSSVSGTVLGDLHNPSLHPHLCPLRQLIFLFYRWENWGSERMNTASVKVAR